MVFWRTILASLTLLIICTPSLVIGQIGSSIQQTYIANDALNPANVMNAKGSNRTYFIRNAQTNTIGAANGISIVRTSFHEKSKKYAFGAEAFNRRLGNYSMNGFGLDYAYRLKFTREKFISLGMRFGIYDAKYRMTNPQNALVAEKGNTKAYANLGLTYHTENTTLEISVPQLLMKSANFIQTEDAPMQMDPFVMARLNHHMNLKNIKTVFSPQFTFYANLPGQIFQVGFAACYTKSYTLLADYNFKHSAKAGFAVDVFNGLKIGYSYQKQFKNEFQRKGRYHEIILQYTMNKKSKNDSKLTETLEAMFKSKPVHQPSKNVPQPIKQTVHMDQASAKDDLATTREFLTKPQTLKKDENNQVIIKQDVVVNKKSIVVNTSGNIKLEKDHSSTDTSAHEELFVRIYSTTELLRQRGNRIVDANRSEYDFTQLTEDQTLVLFGTFSTIELAEAKKAELKNQKIVIHQNRVNEMYYVLIPAKARINEVNFKALWSDVKSMNTTFTVLDFTSAKN